MLLYTLENCKVARVCARPSVHVRSPYLADICFDDDETEQCMAHTPSLGCCGLVEEGCNVMVVPSKNAAKTQSKYTIYNAIVEEYDIIVGTHPQIAQTFANVMLNSAMLDHVFGAGWTWKAEVPMNVDGESVRWDFVGSGDASGLIPIVEVKNVPVADYYDGTKTEKKKWLKAHGATSDPYKKIAIFPDGYRKRMSDPVSPRALKHVQCLTSLAQTGKYKCMMLYVCQRSDCEQFTVSRCDPQYKAAVNAAIEAGVVVVCAAVMWSQDGNATFQKWLPMV